MEKPIISVIIPVYNGEKYLSKCIESLQAQTLKQIEIIIVNDGSMDNTSFIAHQYAERDSRIIVIDKANEGVSVARNTALEIAHGEWIAFSDADDYYYPDGLQNLYDVAKQTVEKIVLGNAARIQMNGTITQRYPFFSQVEVTKTFPKSSLEMWGDLFHHSLFESMEFRFTPGLAYLEDRLLMLKLLSTCGQYATCPTVVYGHYKNLESVLESKNGIRMARHCFWAAKLMKDYSKNAKIFKDEIQRDSESAILRACTYFLKSKNASVIELNKAYHEFFSDSHLWHYFLTANANKLRRQMRNIVKHIFDK